jgi:gluconate kinase
MTSDADPVLDLSNAPPTLFLFGLAGSGKSYVGNLIGQRAGWHVYHADDDLTDEMKLALAEHRPFTGPMRDRFFALIVDKIRQLQQRHPHLVITQAVYKQQHRDYLLARIPAMELVCVSADDATILQRINRRSDGITIASAAALRADFEAPADGCRTIVNDSDAGAIVRQLNNHYGRFRPS